LRINCWIEEEHLRGSVREPNALAWSAPRRRVPGGIFERYTTLQRGYCSPPAARIRVVTDSHHINLIQLARYMEGTMNQVESERKYSKKLNKLVQHNAHNPSLILYSNIQMDNSYRNGKK
jgi:hypothetical protein